ncbi:MAG: hypothetical protein WCT44_03095 [Candidatus Paceibacterota bacterium]
MKKIFPKLNKKQSEGYTIIETMIAVSLFVIIVTVGMNALLNANVLHNKSQDMRSIIDSLSFAMEDISKNLRTGYDYHCIDDGDLALIDSHSCITGTGISFKSSSGLQFIYYLESGAFGDNIFKSVAGDPAVQLLPDEVVIDSVDIFTVSGAQSTTAPTPDFNQPFVTIRLEGHIDYKDTSTPFSLQTSVSQRGIDI